MAALTLAPHEQEQYPELRDRNGYEYLEGKWVKVPTGAESNWNAFQALRRMDNHVTMNDGGVVLPGECALQIWPVRPKSYRKPDGSFFQKGRLPGDRVPQGMVHVPPDLVIESMSPHDKGQEMEDKIQEYFEAGVRLVWVLYPKTRTVHVYRADGTALRLTEDDTLSGEDIIVGFKVRVGDLFQT